MQIDNNFVILLLLLRIEFPEPSRARDVEEARAAAEEARAAAEEERSDAWTFRAVLALVD